MIFINGKWKVQMDFHDLMVMNTNDVPVSSYFIQKQLGCITAVRTHNNYGETSSWIPLFSECQLKCGTEEDRKSSNY